MAAVAVFVVVVVANSISSMRAAAAVAVVMGLFLPILTNVFLFCFFGLRSQPNYIHMHCICMI